MITIVADRYAYGSPPADAVYAAAPSDYVAVRRRIRVALDQDETLTVYATDSVLLGWLADLQRYPEARVTWQVVDPGEEFAQLFGMPPPEPFTPKLLAELRLNELPRPPVGGVVHPLTWVLGHRLDGVWQHDDPPPGHAAALAAWVIDRAMPLDRQSAILAQAQLERWAEHHRVFASLHTASLADDSSRLLIRWALQNYDEDWCRAQPWGRLPVLDTEPPVAALLVALRSQHSSIQSYWNYKIAGKSIDALAIGAALGKMSGLSDAEFSALTTMLRRCPEALSSGLFDEIKRRFGRLPTAEADLRTLGANVIPPEPQLPTPEWPAERWLVWATQEYLPYYSWVIRMGQGRDYQQICALSYSDWLYEQYPAWLNEARSPILLSQYQEVAELVERDEQALVIWLIIDGLAWWQGEFISEACARHGLHLQGQRVGVAVLPSITSISKRALVTGQPTIDLACPTIAEAARVKFARSNISAVVGYSLADAITKLRAGNHFRVALVLYNLIDALAHQTVTFTDNTGIRGHLEDLARELAHASQVCSEQGRRLHILIGSDHGSTLLPSDAKSLGLPISAREIDDVWEPELPGQESQKPGTRAAAIGIDQVPTIDGKAWYLLDRDRFQLDRHYLTPRGYNYIKRRPSGWTHGGLTPEETIVPLLHLSPERQTLVPIDFELRGMLRPGQSGTVLAVLRNLNPFPLKDLNIQVSGTIANAKLQQLGVLDQVELELSFAPVTAQGTELTVSYEVRYTALGSAHQDMGQVRIPLRRLQVEDTAFDDMFN